ncbi:UNVERIFIED_CONTAM: hypothetical protein FKN15_037270 [Acipenser sinensis]
MENIEELITRINRNTAAQFKQNNRWRVELGLPEREPTKLELLLHRWELESAREAQQSPAPEELVLDQGWEEESFLEPKEVEPWPSLEPWAASKGEEVRHLPPSQPQTPLLQAIPALPSVVPCPGIVDTLPECPNLPPLDLAPRSLHCQAQLLDWSLAALPLKPQTSHYGSQTSHALPLPPTVFPLRLQTSLHRSTAAHLCLPFLAILDIL